MEVSDTQYIFAYPSDLTLTIERLVFIDENDNCMHKTYRIVGNLPLVFAAKIHLILNITSGDLTAKKVYQPFSYIRYEIFPP